MNHITPTLMKLHWLPVKYRIECKVLLVYKCVARVAPSYVASLIPPYIPGRFGRRSASSHQRTKRITKESTETELSHILAPTYGITSALNSRIARQ